MSKVNKPADRRDSSPEHEHEHDPGCAVENELGQAAACGCGGINLTMGPMTLHLAAHEAAALHQLMSGALGLIEAPMHSTEGSAMSDALHQGSLIEPQANQRRAPARKKFSGMLH